MSEYEKNFYKSLRELIDKNKRGRVET